VIGPLDAVPFFDLPSLGGSQLLRGYERGRFRGKLALLSTLEYRYPVQEGMAAYLFADAGRVYASWQELSPQPLRDVRLGFGGGLQIYSRLGATFLLQLASSIDGGLFVDLFFNTTMEAGNRH
jgi:outer membrane protein assembly factor BamA